MPRRRRRPPIQVTLVLPAEPPTQEEMDAILMAGEGLGTGPAVVVERLMGWFEDWQGAGQPGWVWPRLETIQRDIKFMLLEAVGERGRRDLVPVLRAWFPDEVRAVRKAINRTLQSLGQRTLPHPSRGKG